MPPDTSGVRPLSDRPDVARILDELAHWHRQYERAADPDDFASAGSTEAAQLSGRVGELLAALGRPVSLG
ncbi:hypothetical protein A5658_03605 [Mycobacterium sp. 1245111.1]|nr:hypothetical protein A5658_03605 [Mycobacterium sp. 1245111.1]